MIHFLAEYHCHFTRAGTVEATILLLFRPSFVTPVPEI